MFMYVLLRTLCTVCIAVCGLTFSAENLNMCSCLYWQTRAMAAATVEITLLLLAPLALGVAVALRAGPLYHPPRKLPSSRITLVVPGPV